MLAFLIVVGNNERPSWNSKTAVPSHDFDQYREIQVNQLSEASEAGGFLPPIQTTGMYSMVH